MTFVGIDYDTRYIHLCKIAEEEPADQPRYMKVALEGNDAFDRTRSIRNVMLRRTNVYWDDVQAIGIEEPMGPGHITAKLKAVQGGVLQCLPTGLLVHPLSPSEWRKAAGISGRASKEEVQDHVRGLLGENPHWPQDAFDAWCIAVAVRALVVVG